VKVRTMICLLFASNDIIPGKTQPGSLLSVKRWHPMMQQHTGITINVEIGS